MTCAANPTARIQRRIGGSSPGRTGEMGGGEEDTWGAAIGPELAGDK